MLKDPHAGQAIRAGALAGAAAWTSYRIVETAFVVSAKTRERIDLSRRLKRLIP